MKNPNSWLKDDRVMTLQETIYNLHNSYGVSFDDKGATVFWQTLVDIEYAVKVSEGRYKLTALGRMKLPANIENLARVLAIALVKTVEEEEAKAKTKAKTKELPQQAQQPSTSKTSWEDLTWEDLMAEAFQTGEER